MATGAVATPNPLLAPSQRSGIVELVARSARVRLHRRRRWLGAGAGLAAAAVIVAVVLHQVWLAAPAANVPAPTGPVGGVRVMGNFLVATDGHPVQLDGVSRSGTEYECLTGNAIFDGPAGASAVAAISTWHVDAVRLPLNEDCWLGVNGVPAATSGDAYRNAITAFVRQLEARGMVVDIDLHWSAAGAAEAKGQQQMPDEDHAVGFWRSVASAFGHDPEVIFELYNEPYGVSWSCWRNGCWIPARDGTHEYLAVGMQDLVDVVRTAGARNPLILDGLARASDLSGWRTYEPEDPLHALVAGWHLYGPSPCLATCWQRSLTEMQGAPLLVTEFGEVDCGSAYVLQLMSWLDARGIGYLAWAWDTWRGCSGPSLIASYAGAPHGAYGAAVMHHMKVRFPAS